MTQLDAATLSDILWRIDNDLDNWRDRARLRAHIQAQAAENAALRAEVEAHDYALQAQTAELAAIRSHGGARYMITTPNGDAITVNGVTLARADVERGKRA